MSVRYIFNTKGDYVAFIINGYLFSSTSEWLGIMQKGNLVYSKEGKFIGYLLKDDRIARKKNELPKLNILRPLRPLRPLKPLKPLKRMAMAPLRPPYEDIFESSSIRYKKNIIGGGKENFEKFLGSKIIAEDGTYLGTVSKDKYNSESISNPYNDYGSPYSAHSILNQYSNYGSPYSALSPFNPYSNTPPHLVKNGKIISYLTINKYISGGVDTKSFLKWLGF